MTWRKVKINAIISLILFLMIISLIVFFRDFKWFESAFIILSLGLSFVFILRVVAPIGITQGERIATEQMRKNMHNHPLRKFFLIEKDETNE